MSSQGVLNVIIDQLQSLKVVPKDRRFFWPTPLLLVSWGWKSLTCGPRCRLEIHCSVKNFWLIIASDAPSNAPAFWRRSENPCITHLNGISKLLDMVVRSSSLVRDSIHIKVKDEEQNRADIFIPPLSYQLSESSISPYRATRCSLSPVLEKWNRQHTAHDVLSEGSVVWGSCVLPICQVVNSRWTWRRTEHLAAINFVL